MIEVIGALYEKATQKHGIGANQSMQAQGISLTKQTEEKKQRVNRIASHALFQKKKKKHANMGAAFSSRKSYRLRLD